MVVFLFLGFNLAAAANHSLEIKETRRKAKEEKRAIKENLQEAERAIKEENREELSVLRKKAGEEKKALNDKVNEKIAGIKNTAKRERAQRLNDKLAERNKNRTDQLASRLRRIAERLAKWEKQPEAAAKAASQIAAAKTAIEESQEAIELQSSKVYQLEFKNEDKLKNAFAIVKQMLQDDLRAVRRLVKNAQQAAVAVKKAINPKDENDD